jgi:hypothetical protein
MRDLEQELANLARRIEPRRDLWPTIQARITDRRGWHTTWAMAACLLLSIGVIRAGWLLPAPNAAMTVDAALVDLDTAETELRAAIRAQPFSVPLNQLLANVVRQRIKLKLQSHTLS